MPTNYQRSILHWHYNRFFIDATIDSSSTLLSILHQFCNRCHISSSSIPHRFMSHFLVQFFIDTLSTLHQFSIDFSSIHHWFFIDSSPILYSSSSLHWFFTLHQSFIGFSSILHWLFIDFSSIVYTSLIASVSSIAYTLLILSVSSIFYTSLIFLRLIDALQFIEFTFGNLIDSLRPNRFYLH